MSPNLISKDELIAAGWNSRQIHAALDEPDEVGPSGHWLNASGKPYYERERVAVAAFRIGLSDDEPSPNVWTKWARSELPTSLPTLTMSFHRLADSCIDGASHKFSSLRLSHPIMGRQGGTREREKKLIEDVLFCLVGHAFDVALKNSIELDQFLRDRAVIAAPSLGEHWPNGIAVRCVRRASYVSRATGKRSIQRCIDAMSLVHTGQVRSADARALDLIPLLVQAPSLRFDRRALSDIQS